MATRRAGESEGGGLGGDAGEGGGLGGEAGASRRRADVVLVVVASLAFATASPLGKVAGSVPAIVVACARTGIAALVLMVVGWSGFVPAVRALSSKQRAAVALAGALLAAHFALFLGGLGATSLAAAVALVSLEPIAVVLAAFVAFGLRPTRREMLGLLVATLGAVVVASGAGSGEHRLLGDVMVVGAVILYGAYVAAARGLKDAMPALPYAAAVYGVATLVLLPVALVLGVNAGIPSAQPALAVLAMALLPTLIGHTLTQRVARRASPVLVALISPGETVGSLAIGAVVLGVRPSRTEALGCAMVIVGAAVVALGRGSGGGGGRGDGRGRRRGGEA